MITRATSPLTFSSALVVAIGACGAPPSPRPAPAAPAAASSAGAPQASNAPASTPRSAVLALAKRDQTLAIVDPVSLTILAKVPVGEDPHEVVATEDGKTAFVSNYGGGSLHTLAVVDLVAQSALPSVDLGALRGPHGLAAKGGKIWFTAEGSKAVGSYDPAQHEIDWVMGTGQDRTHMIFVADDLSRVVTTNVSSGTVSFLERALTGPGNGGHGPPRERWEQTVVPVAPGDEGFDVSPDRKEMWVANAGPGTVSILDLASKTVIRTLDGGVVGANRLRFTPDGKRVLISSLRGGGLAVYDAPSRTLVKTLPMGRGTEGILVQPDGRRAFVACSPDDDIAVVDLATLSVVGHLAVGHEPDGLAWVDRP